MGICCMAQETQTGALYQPRGVRWGGRWEGGSKGRGYMYTYSWFILRFDRKQQNSVKQLSFNKNIFLKSYKPLFQKKATCNFKWLILDFRMYCRTFSWFTIPIILYIYERRLRAEQVRGKKQEKDSNASFLAWRWIGRVSRNASGSLMNRVIL